MLFVMLVSLTICIFLYVWCFHDLGEYIDKILENRFEISKSDFIMCIFLGILPFIIPIFGCVFTINFLYFLDNKC